jgi:hypothetical protein
MFTTYFGPIGHVVYRLQLQRKEEEKNVQDCYNEARKNQESYKTINRTCAWEQHDTNKTTRTAEQ